MSRAPSAETQLRASRSQLRRVTKQLTATAELCEQYRRRATQAEQQAAEWQRRFDALLAKVPAVTVEELVEKINRAAADGVARIVVKS